MGMHPLHQMAEEEYLLFEEGSDICHEYYRG